MLKSSTNKKKKIVLKNGFNLFLKYLMQPYLKWNDDWSYSGSNSRAFNFLISF